MNAKYLLIFILITTYIFKENNKIFAQNVSINLSGNPPSSSAILDLSDPSNVGKGLLLPRMTSAQMDAIDAPPLGLMIYNTTTNSIHTNIASGTKLWNKLSDTTAWNYLGNILGGTSTNYFIGSTDDSPLNFKTNNIQRLKITNQGAVGLGTSSPNSIFHVYKTIPNTYNQSSFTQVTIDVKNEENLDSLNLLRVALNNTSVIQDFYGVKIGDVNSSTNSSIRNSGTINNTYGLFIGDLSNGTQTNKYSLYSSDQNTYNYFGGNVGIGTTEPKAMLHIVASAGKTGIKYEDGSGNKNKTFTLDSSGNFVVTKPGQLKYDVVFSDGSVSPYTLTNDDYLYSLDDAGALGMDTVYLPECNADNNGKIFVINRAENTTSDIKIFPNGTNKIDKSIYFYLGAGATSKATKSVQIVCDGDPGRQNWVIISWTNSK